ncbi:phage holin family protein [Trabulsiella odontotermitis]|uniref:phage holin family protein n=1 Tax=Trabulsiella odontotermitis TaxID=379893 RepID=UPI0006767E27|nr:phage holin family protein [Trabulsiella odontotermitis]
MIAIINSALLYLAEIIQPATLYLNSLVLALITARLMVLSQGNQPTHLLVRVMTYGLILAPAYTAFRIWFGTYTNVDYGEFLINLFLCVAVWRAGGNISRLS